MFDYLIVGAGFAGSVLAERLSGAGKSVLLCDKRPHVGGNAFDFEDEAGILIHKYGPHIFHTRSSGSSATCRGSPTGDPTNTACSPT